MTNTETKSKHRYVRDHYADYEAADLRAVYFYAKARVLDDNDRELASAYGTEGDRQTDLLAEAHSAIVRTRVRNLEDVYCKLLTIKDGFSIIFKQGGEEMKEQRLMLEDAIEWVRANWIYGDEQLPDSPSPEIENQEAA